MVAGEDKLTNRNYNPQNTSHMDYEMQHLREKLCRLEKMLSQKEKCGIRKTVDIALENEKSTTHTIPINEGVENEEPFGKQIQDIEYTAEDYISQISDLEQKLLRDEKFSDKDYYEHVTKKLSILELYRNLKMLEENRQYFYKEPKKLSELYQNKVGAEYETKNHYRHFSRKKGKKQLIYGHSCNENHKHNSLTYCSCSEYENNLRQKTERNKLNVSSETAHRQVPIKKATCRCPEISSSSDDSEESFYKCLHMPKDYYNELCNYKNKDEVSESSNEDQTTCSEVSKCTCYCSKDHSHDESSEADSDCDCDCKMRISIYENKNKTRPERFRGGLDVIKPIMEKSKKYDINLKEQGDCSISANDLVDNLKLLKVEELREGLERLKIRNRNLRDFLDTLQRPINLIEKPSEANTICTQVSSCYTVDVAKQTRSGLLTVVEVLKGKCRSKDAMIVALADGLKVESDKKINILDTEKDKIITKNKSLISGMIEEKDNGRKFTKRDSAIGFVFFLMILISHVKRSEIISYLSAAKNFLLESPFKLGLLISETDNLLIDLIFTYNRDFVYSFKRFTKHLVERWANIMLQLNHRFSSYYAPLQQLFNISNNFLTANYSYVLFGVCTILVGVTLINIKKIWTSRLIIIKEYRRFSIIIESVGVKLAKLILISCQQVLSSKIFWFTLGFYSQILWNSIQTDFYQFSTILNSYYVKNTGHTLFQHLNETQEVTDYNCKLFDKFHSYSWLISIFCNEFQRFVKYLCYIIKNV
ncbi:uncharacterized protein LOC131663992 [Phymastichus coffea]|uniref:uncharacterized protein LOC131663992 n=1 Tax=Phymastichus coffea TaxID=108790 RepID=UPI00273CC261|nr:uncharacterized protein LOC131663992 [Phymastichus coffea]